MVLNAGRGSSGGATLWQSGFLPSTYEGVLFRTSGEPVLNLDNPKGLPPELQHLGLNILRQINEGRYKKIQDPEIASRIASYELASRMQTAAPELIDLSKENEATKQAYGLTQLMPATALGLGVNRYDVEGNLRGGATYLRQQLDRFGHYHLALAAYNAGPGRVKNGRIPRISETQNYVSNILSNWTMLKLALFPTEKDRLEAVAH